MFSFVIGKRVFFVHFIQIGQVLQVVFLLILVVVVLLLLLLFVDAQLQWRGP